MVYPRPSKSAVLLFYQNKHFIRQAGSQDWQEDPNVTRLPLIQRIFANPFRCSTNLTTKAKPKVPMALIQQGLRDAVQGCTDVRSQRIQYKIDMAKTPVELWALRGDLHQCIAQLYSERVAAARINDVATMFEGWIPANQLTRIQPGFRHSEK